MSATPVPSVIHPKSKFRAHPLADQFPMIDEKIKPSFVADMKRLGFDPNKPVVLLNGLVLDGRNRIFAAMEAGISEQGIPTRQFDPLTDGTPGDFVIRENLSRRQLSHGQLSLIAKNLAKNFADEFKTEAELAEEKAAAEAAAKGENGDKGVEGGTSEASASGSGEGTGVTNAPKAEGKEEDRASHKARKKAAAALGVSESSVKRAKQVGKYPDLEKAVQDKKMTLAAAHKEASARDEKAKTQKAQDKLKEKRTDMIAVIAKHLGGEEHEFVKAVKRGTLLNESKELAAVAALSKKQLLKFLPALVQKRTLKSILKSDKQDIGMTSTLVEIINKGLLEGSDGNYSFRVPGYEISVKASGKPKAEAKPEKPASKPEKPADQTPAA